MFPYRLSECYINKSEMRRLGNNSECKGEYNNTGHVLYKKFDCILTNVNL